MRIRQFRPGDEPFLSDICLKTADAGADATGVLPDGELWAHIFALPYAERHPDLAFVVANDADEPVGYVLGTDDTDAFEDWFANEYWPRLTERFPNPSDDDESREAGLLKYAYARRAGAEPYGTDHPAHLHIDLLPEAQGAGWGRKAPGGGASLLRCSRMHCEHATSAHCTSASTQTTRTRLRSTSGSGSHQSRRIRGM